MKKLSSFLVVAFVTSGIVSATPAGALLPVSGPGCVAGAAQIAADVLLGQGSTIANVAPEGSLNVANVEIPLIAPFTRGKLIAAGGSWCDAVAGFNTAALASGLASKPEQLAKSFAKLGAAQYFDEVTVLRSKATALGRVELTTHARTNGIIADWTIDVDKLGVRSAVFVAKEFAVEPFEAQSEGLTALPGLTVTFSRAIDGSLTPSTDPRYTNASDYPVEITSTTFSDDFTIHTTRTDAPRGVTLTDRTGVQQLDIGRIAQDAAIENYNDFLEWGLVKGWTSDEGYLYIDDALSLACFACVFIRQDFQIHMSSEVVLILRALGYSYDATRHDDAFSNIVGHEMAHNFQNAYYKPGGAQQTGQAFSEGIARFQETLHDYSDVSHQSKSLVYAADTNGCNGYGVHTKGPGSKSYNACRFWMSFYNEYGIAGLRTVLESSFEHAPGNNAEEIRDMVEEVAGAGNYTNVLAKFAAFSLAPRDADWGSVDGSLPARDWADYLNTWNASVLAPSNSQGISLSQHGMQAFELTTSGTVSVVVPAPGEPVAVYEIRDDSTTKTITPFTGLSKVIDEPATGERVWVVVILNSPSSGNSTISFN